MTNRTINAHFLDLIVITNDAFKANYITENGVGRIMIDLEKKNKDIRQLNKNTWISNHVIEDVAKIRKVLKNKNLIVRIESVINGGLDQVNNVLKNGADYIMLPMFRTVEEVKEFISHINGRAKSILLFETKESIENIDEILNIEGIDECYIGLNDLSISLGQKFLFESLTDGYLERVVDKFKAKNLKFGFGGIGSVSKGIIPAEKLIYEHRRLGSEMVILSRSFSPMLETDLSLFQIRFKDEIDKVLFHELKAVNMSHIELCDNLSLIKDKINLYLDNW
jgi:2-keto-3-deoxy-L-rhamnonate aldolase RhmA